MALAETLQDDFEFGGLDSGKWTTSGGAQVVVGTATEQNLQLSSVLGGNYVSINSSSTYSLIASYVFSRVVNAGNQSITSWEVYPVYLVADSNNKIFIRIAAGQVQPIKVVAAATTNIGPGINYDPERMKWFRIREAGGSTYFEYASDPTRTWAEITHIANPITLTALTVEVVVGTWQSEGTTTTAKIDNLNVLPSQYQFSWQGFAWNKRIHAGPPANNQTWSAANVGTPDSNDYLTLTLSNAGSAPVGCEIFSDRRGFGYGTYTAVIATRLDNIAPATCFGGMFTFDFTAPPDYKEIDMHETRDYGQQITKDVLYSHVWNSAGSATFITDSVALTSDTIQTHQCMWTPTGITFKTYQGQGVGGTLLNSFTHTTHLPTPGNERVHFNIFVDVAITGFATVPALNVIMRQFSFAPFVAPVTATGVTIDRRSLIAASGGTVTGKSSEWREFMVAQGGTGAMSEQDAEMRFLASKGFTQPTYADRMTAYLASKGFTTGTIGDKYSAWLRSGVL